MLYQISSRTCKAFDIQFVPHGQFSTGEKQCVMRCALMELTTMTRCVVGCKLKLISGQWAISLFSQTNVLEQFLKGKNSQKNFIVYYLALSFTHRPLTNLHYILHKPTNRQFLVSSTTLKQKAFFFSTQHIPIRAMITLYPGKSE